MTAFEEWSKRSALYVHPELREGLVECWNAAVDECARWISGPADELSDDARLMANAVRVTPIRGKMRKGSQ